MYTWVYLVKCVHAGPSICVGIREDVVLEAMGGAVLGSIPGHIYVCFLSALVILITRICHPRTWEIQPFATPP
jgi:hypothetical protein